MSDRRPRLCIVALYAYPLLRPEVRSPFGGSEVRVSILARELARRGRFDVSLVVYDHGQPAVEVVDGVQVHARVGERAPPIAPPIAPPGGPPAAASRDHVRRLARSIVRRVLRPARTLRGSIRRRLSPPPPPAAQIGVYSIAKSRLELYEQIDPDILLVPGNSMLSAEASTFSKAHGRRYVFLAGSDGDYDPAFAERPNEIGIYGSFGYLQLANIRAADVHIVQNARQAELLKRHFGKGSVVLENPIDLERPFPRAANPDGVLWVGKSDPNKRPEIVLELARRMPDRRFTLLMTYANPLIHSRVLDDARGLPNVDIETYVPFDQVERYFADARVFLNTSSFEGFPNTFLQAAKYEVPIVSLTVDPGGMLSAHGAGLVAGGDVDRLADGLRRILGSEREQVEIGARGLAFVRAHHDKERIAAALEACLLELIAGRGPC